MSLHIKRVAKSALRMQRVRVNSDIPILTRSKYAKVPIELQAIYHQMLHESDMSGDSNSHSLYPAVEACRLWIVSFISFQNGQDEAGLPSMIPTLMHCYHIYFRIFFIKIS